MKYGDRVKLGWQQPKYGEYMGQVKHTIKHKGPQLAFVLFDGNKWRSKVPVAHLETCFKA